ncbi:class I SAM-dependent methyltransferase, partial [Thermodesulfobacteriota bacterium]
PREAEILDIGSGTGDITDELARRRDARCVRLDRRRLFMHGARAPSLLCDAGALALGAGRFDHVLLVTVLHHCGDPEAVLAEAKRICMGRILVVEDIFTSRAERLLTIVKDALLNLELIGHPRQFHSTDEWERIFADLGLTIETKEMFRFRLLWVVRFRNVMYVLKGT